MRILGVDLGTRRIGLAISDETATLATGLAVYERTTLANDVQYLRVLVEEREIKQIALGLPLNMNGSLGPRASEALAFKAELEKALTIPVEVYDERLTTVEAERVLIEADLSRRRRKKLIDRQAAVLILQGFLDKRRA